MSRIRFTVEDSKVSEVLKLLLDSNIEINNWEVKSLDSDEDVRVPTPHIPSKEYLEDPEPTWNPWGKKPIGKDPFYVKVNDERFDYTGSTKMPDNVYQYQSTTDVKSPNNWIPKVKTSTGCTVETETLAKPSSELEESDKTISMKSELDFPYFKES